MNNMDWFAKLLVAVVADLEGRHPGKVFTAATSGKLASQQTRWKTQKSVALDGFGCKDLPFGSTLKSGQFTKEAIKKTEQMNNLTLHLHLRA